MGIELFEGSKKPTVSSQENPVEVTEVNTDVSESEITVSDRTSLK